MLRIADALAAAAIAALLALPPGPAAGEVLHLPTEQYAPFNFDQDGEIKGLGADQVREIMRRSGLAYDMELLPWSRAIGLARAGSDARRVWKECCSTCSSRGWPYP